MIGELRSKRGYTAVEVLSAMTLFAIGAAGVIGMMKVNIQGQADTRRFDMATHLAHQWIARLQRDSMYWTTPSRNTAASNHATATKWIRDIGLAACDGNQNGGKFCVPNAALPAAGAEIGSSSAYDIAGRDLSATATEHFFCVQHRLSWLIPVQTANCGTTAPCPNALIRADVRVFFKRQEYGSIPDCAAAIPDAAPNQYHFVYATTSLRENQER